MIDAVIKIGGRGAEDDKALRDLGKQLASFSQSGRWMAVVHGGGAALDEYLARRGWVTQKKNGIRVTPKEVVPDILALLGGVLNKRIVQTFSECSVHAVGLTGIDGGIIQAEKVKYPDFDPGQVGRVIGGNPNLLQSLMARGFVPVLAPIAADAQGEFLNVNADSFAAGVARLLGAKRLILLTDVPGILDAEKKLINRVNPFELEVLMGRGVISGGMIPKVRAALDALEESGCEVVIAEWSAPNVLRRIANGESVGTIISPSARAEKVLE